MEGHKIKREDLLSSPVRDITIRERMSISEFIECLENVGGFTAKKLWTAAKILEDMLMDKDAVVFLSFPAAIMATGIRGVLVDLVKRGFVDVIITTCGTLDHDIARTLSEYFEGDFMTDDSLLRDLDIHRLGSVFVPMESYGKTIENFMRPILKELYEDGCRCLSTRELSWEIGKKLNSERSLLTQCFIKKVPIYVPGISDGAVGSQIWLFKETHRDFIIDVFKDEEELADIIFEAKKTGALMIGGGISKHHTIWWNQFRDGLDYAVYITTAPEWDGSLSGARIREAVSWGKVKQRAKYVTVEGEATVILPLLYAYVVDKIKERNIKNVLGGVNR